MFSKPTYLCAVLAIGLSFIFGTTAFANNPYLEYDPPTGNVILFPNDTNITAFNLQSDGRFIPNFSSTGLMSSTIGVPGLVDNTPESIGWVSAIAAGGNGFGLKPEHQSGADIGDIFPVGLDVAGLNGLLIANAWAGPGGMSGSFDLTIRVPEPATVTLLLVGLMTFARRRA